jgi:cytoplasmic iron level regulating protein YaaA (DUF328/UPF0246 family)
MKILFSPSEAKNSGGVDKKIDFTSYLFESLYKKRLEAVEIYKKYIDSITTKDLMKLFGIKNIDSIELYSQNIFDKPILKPIQRYSGVAYKYLDYETLEEMQKRYIDSNVVIFSNLFGPILAGGEGIPEYKLKQNEAVGEYKLEEFYKKNFTKALDEYLYDEDILDLRAGFYNKFYSISSSYTTLKFLKNGKVVSHWAKAYRGVVLRSIAKSGIRSINELISMNIDGLNIVEIKQIGFKQEVVYESI